MATRKRIDLPLVDGGTAMVTVSQVSSVVQEDGSSEVMMRNGKVFQVSAGRCDIEMYMDADEDVFCWWDRQETGWHNLERMRHR